MKYSSKCMFCRFFHWLVLSIRPPTSLYDSKSMHIFPRAVWIYKLGSFAQNTSMSCCVFLHFCATLSTCVSLVLRMPPGSEFWQIAKRFTVSIDFTERRLTFNEIADRELPQTCLRLLSFTFFHVIRFISIECRVRTDPRGMFSLHMKFGACARSTMLETLSLWFWEPSSQGAGPWTSSYAKPAKGGSNIGGVLPHRRNKNNAPPTKDACACDVLRSWGASSVGDDRPVERVCKVQLTSFGSLHFISFPEACT